MPTTRTVIVFSSLAFAAASLISACDKKPSVSFSLDVPSAIATNAAFYEIGAFSGSTCPPASQFAGGIPTAGAAAHIAFAANDPNPPGIGDLPRGTYAFAAAAKAADCGVIGVGCSVVDVSSSNVTITLHANDPPTGACASGAVCQNAECIPASDNNDPSVGAGCSLDLLGAGPFADPLAISGTLASAPAIAATDSGFLIGYREYDPVAGVARLTLLPVDNSGGSGAIHLETLPNRCADEDESDAIGMAFSTASDGLVAIARAPCNGTGGFDLYDVGSDAGVNSYGTETSATLATSVLSLSTSHAVAPTNSGYFVVYTKDGVALVNTTSGVQFAGTASTFGGAPPQSGAWVATSDQLEAFLAGAIGTDTTVVDSGSDDSGDDSGSSPEGDGGPIPILRLNVAAPGTDPGTFGAPYEFPGAWGSLAAQGTRLIVASSGDSSSEPVIWRAFDLGTDDPTAQDGFNVSGLGAVSYADVAFHLDNMFFAVETPGGISLVSYSHATTTPVFSREVVFGNNPRIPALSGLRDGRLAVVASDTRVAVAWVTGRELAPDDAVGGYAIFACR